MPVLSATPSSGATAVERGAFILELGARARTRCSCNVLDVFAIERGALATEPRVPDTEGAVCATTSLLEGGVARPLIWGAGAVR